MRLHETPRQLLPEPFAQTANPAKPIRTAHTRTIRSDRCPSTAETPRWNVSNSRNIDGHVASAEIQRGYARSVFSGSVECGGICRDSTAGRNPGPRTDAQEYADDPARVLVDSSSSDVALPCDWAKQAGGLHQRATDGCHDRARLHETSRGPKRIPLSKSLSTI